jgi:hypothetical protein
MTSRRQQVNFQWDDDEVCFVLNQHAELDFYIASSPKQHSAGRHVKWVYILILSHVIIISKIISIALMHIGNLVPFWLSCTCIWILIFLLPRIFKLFCLSCTCIWILIFLLPRTFKLFCLSCTCIWILIFLLPGTIKLFCLSCTCIWVLIFLFKCPWEQEYQNPYTCTR